MLQLPSKRFKVSPSEDCKNPFKGSRRVHMYSHPGVNMIFEKTLTYSLYNRYSIYFRMYLYISIYIYISISIYIYISIYISIYLSIYLSIYIHIYFLNHKEHQVLATSRMSSSISDPSKCSPRTFAITGVHQRFWC